MTVATNDLARVFLFPTGVNACNVRPVYGDCFSVDGLTQDNGDVTRIECPDPTQYGKFREMGVIRGEKGRLTTTLSRRMIIEEIAQLRKLFDEDCPFDAHLHWGVCTDPTAFNQYAAAWVLRDVYVTNWSTDPVVALQSGDRNPVNESIDVSAGDFYQILATLRYTARAATLTTDPVVDLAICGFKSCGGDACPPSNGCDKVYAISDACQLFVSLDGGGTWNEIAVTCPGDPAETPVGVTCLGDYVVIVTAEGSYIYDLRNNLDLDDASWASVQGAITVGTDGNPIGIHTVFTSTGPVALIYTDTGRIFALDSNLNLTLQNDEVAADAAINNMASGSGVIVAALDGGVVMVNSNGIWSQTANAPTATDLHSVVVKTAKNWYVGGEDGELWCTADGGCTWAQVVFPESAEPGTVVTDMAMSNTHVLWMAAGGRIYRSIDGGSSWVIEPNDSSPGCRIAAAELGTVSKVVACTHDPNRIMGVGTADTAGLIVLGE